MGTQPSLAVEYTISWPGSQPLVPMGVSPLCQHINTIQSQKRKAMLHFQSQQCNPVIILSFCMKLSSRLTIYHCCPIRTVKLFYLCDFREQRNTFLCNFRNAYELLSSLFRCVTAAVSEIGTFRTGSAQSSLIFHLLIDFSELLGLNRVHYGLVLSNACVLQASSFCSTARLIVLSVLSANAVSKSTMVAYFYTLLTGAFFDQYQNMFFHKNNALLQIFRRTGVEIRPSNSPSASGIFEFDICHTRPPSLYHFNKSLYRVYSHSLSVFRSEGHVLISLTYASL